MPNASEANFWHIPAIGLDTARRANPHRLGQGIKVAVIDSEWATVGSSNLDPLSLVLSREANVVVYDQAFAQQLEASLEIALRHHARQISHGDWNSRSLWERLLSRLVFGLVRVLAAWVGYGMGEE